MNGIQFLRTATFLLLFLLGAFLWLGIDDAIGDDKLDWRAGTLIGSEHYQSDFDYNQKNPGFYACIEGWCAGRYENSYYETSTFIAHRWTIGHLGAVEFSADLGAVDGYKGYETDNEWMAYGSLSARFAVFKLWQVGKVTAWGLELTSDDLRRWTQ